MHRAVNERSGFEPELARVAEVAVGEAIQEAKASDTVKAGGRCCDADSENAPSEIELGDRDANAIDVGP